MGYVAAAATLLSAAVSTYSAVQQGEAQAEAAKAAQKQHQMREEAQRTAALQDEAARREELMSRLSTIDAIRAGRGLSGTSPTALVIRDDVTDDAMRDMGISRLNTLNGAESSRQAGIQEGRNARAALNIGYTRAAGSLLDFGAGAIGMAGGGSLANSNPDFQGTYKGRKVSYMPNSGSKF